MDDVVMIGVVDSGFSPLQKPLVLESACFLAENGVACWLPSTPDRLLHGSRIIDVIAGLAPNARFLVAQVFTERFATSAMQVAEALDWLTETGAHLINLSLGLREDRPVLREACKQAVRSGVILCASSPARGDPVYPSAYDGVLRMTGDARCTPEQWSCLGTRFADFGGHPRSCDGATAGASMGTAHMSGHLARFLTAGHSRSAVAAREHLAHNATYFGAERRAEN